MAPLTCLDTDVRDTVAGLLGVDEPETQGHSGDGALARCCALQSTDEPRVGWQDPVEVWGLGRSPVMERVRTCSCASRCGREGGEDSTGRRNSSLVLVMAIAMCSVRDAGFMGRTVVSTGRTSGAPAWAT